MAEAISVVRAPGAPGRGKLFGLVRANGEVVAVAMASLKEESRSTYEALRRIKEAVPPQAAFTLGSAGQAAVVVEGMRHLVCTAGEVMGAWCVREHATMRD